MHKKACFQLAMDGTKHPQRALYWWHWFSIFACMQNQMPEKHKRVNFIWKGGGKGPLFPELPLIYCDESFNQALVPLSHKLLEESRDSLSEDLLTLWAFKIINQKRGIGGGFFGGLGYFFLQTPLNCQIMSDGREQCESPIELYK